MKIKVSNLTKVFAVVSSAYLYGCGGGSAETKTNPTAIDPVAPVTSESDWVMVWNDEFDGDSIDTTKWNHEVNCLGGGNNEQQCYTDSRENSFLADGMLNIVAKPAPEGSEKPYTSARMTTQNKGDFKYGRFEMRAKLPKGQGSWPAFWMMPTDSVYGGWPRSGEIDIVESVNLGTARADGSAETHVYGTLHYGREWPNNSSSGQAYMLPDGVNPADDFHTYAIEWQEGEIRWYVDSYLYATQRKSEVRTNGDGVPFGLSHKGWFTEYFDQTTGELTTFWTTAPYDQDFFMILNFAVGGSWPENVNELGIDPAAFEGGQAYQIDYVRVYQCAQDPDTGKGCETVRGGYDMMADEHPQGALIEGAAPVPTLPAPPTAEPLTIFADSENPEWPLWDNCCGPAESEVTTDDLDPSRGAVAEFRVLDNSGTVLGFNSREGTGSPYNASALIDGGTFSFDMRVVTPPTSDTTWMIKIEGNNSPSPAFEVALDTSNEGMAPVTGEWQTYTFPVSAIADSGLDITAIDVIMIFPAWATGEGAVYRIDNVNFGGVGGGSSPELNVFIDEESLDWAIWDNCCGPTSSAVLAADDTSRGNVVQYEILDNSGAVVGFNSRAGVGGGTSFDASSIISNGVLQFDMLVVSPPTSETSWLVKVEGNNSPSPAFEVNLNTSQEGADPVVGQWQTYTFPLSAVAEAGTDISALDVILVFPAWATGEGAVYQLDNVRVYDPNAGGVSGPLVHVYNDMENPDWPIFDNCCGPAESEILMDDAEHGLVTEFRILDNSGTVLGYNTRTDAGGTGMPFDASAIAATGVLQFDMKVETAPAADTNWLIKIEGNNSPSPAFEVNLNTSQEGADPVTGQWQTYTFPLTAIADAGTDISAIDVVLVFPAWGTGEGAVYRIDNLAIGNPSDIAGGANGGGSDDAALSVFVDQVNEAWPLWDDCCGPAESEVVMDDSGERGALAEFRILDNSGAVVGFNSRNGNGTAFDASTIVTTGKFSFDMKVVAAPNQDTWLVKIEGANTPSPAFEVNLNTSLEGAEPVVGEWQTYTFDLLTIMDSGVDVSAIDVIMVFPLWGTGEGAVYQLDNVVFTEQ